MVIGVLLTFYLRTAIGVIRAADLNNDRIAVVVANRALHRVLIAAPLASRRAPQRIRCVFPVASVAADVKTGLP